MSLLEILEGDGIMTILKREEGGEERGVFPLQLEIALVPCAGEKERRICFCPKRRRGHISKNQVELEGSWTRFGNLSSLFILDHFPSKC
eukprot:9530709-Ditylum_brightwellii.AAC.1